MPNDRALPGESIVTTRSLIAISPEEGRCAPDKSLTKVDLPAPLSPTKATTSPSPIRKLKSSSATTAAKCFDNPRVCSHASLLFKLASHLAKESSSELSTRHRSFQGIGAALNGSCLYLAGSGFVNRSTRSKNIDLACQATTLRGLARRVEKVSSSLEISHCLRGRLELSSFAPLAGILLSYCWPWD